MMDLISKRRLMEDVRCCIDDPNEVNRINILVAQQPHVEENSMITKTIRNMRDEAISTYTDLLRDEESDIGVCNYWKGAVDALNGILRECGERING